MSTNQANEAATMLDEIEDDALQNDEPLHIDQRISIAGIRASLASVEATRAQTAALLQNGELLKHVVGQAEAAVAEAEAEEAPQHAGSKYMSEQSNVGGEVGQCRFMAAAYPTLTAEDTCGEHRHDEATFALAKALAVVCQHPEPTDEQIGWLLNDAAAVVDDFDPLPTEWTATEPTITDEAGLDFTMTINGVDYVIQQSEWEPSHPVSRAEWNKWTAEDDDEPTAPAASGAGA